MLLGAPTIEPVPGNRMGDHVQWRWVMGLVAICGAIVTVAAVLPLATVLKRLKTRDGAEGRGCERWPAAERCAQYDVEPDQ
jgi:predicted MFS family arabinose efflux permease